MKKILLMLAVFFMTGAAMAQSGLKAGAKAPNFTVVDNSGKKIKLNDLLKKNNAVVLFFYRGQWCPYCNKHLKELQDSLQTLTSKGAYVLGITPETNDNIDKTIEKTKASFTIAQDKGYQIMKAYDVNFVMEQSMVDKYKTYGVDLNANNGNTDHMLPVPATYVINKKGIITFVHFDKDYTKRAPVSLLAQKVEQAQSM